MAGTARSQSTDPFQTQRFHIVDTEGYLNLSTPAAGFNSVMSPETNQDIVEYQEGHYLYRRKYPGAINFLPITLTKGMVKNDTSFFKWMRASQENRSYRTNLIIKHYHRDDVTGLVDYLSATPTKEIHLFNVLPMRVKTGTDFEALSVDTSIEELEVEMEYFRLFENGQEVGPSTINS
jgi:phage tail-like protein